MGRTTTSEAAVRWPGYRHVVFDCDSTLSGIEGIDELAGAPGLRAEIEELTERAMHGAADLAEVYERRLSILRPDSQQVASLRARYKQSEVADAQSVIAFLHDVGHEVYVVSGGLSEPVREFAIHLGVPADHVEAVDMTHDPLSGSWWRSGSDVSQDYVSYESGALTKSDGKAEAITKLIGSGEGGVMMVGDGESDLRTRESVDLFVGFTGFVNRPVVAESADVVISDTLLAPVAALAIGPLGAELTSDSHVLLDSARSMYQEGTFRFNNSVIESRFVAAMGYQRSPS